MLRKAPIILVTKAWSAAWGRPDTVTVPTTPAAALPDIEAQPVRDLADLRSVRRKPVVAGLINEYHHAA
jgi:hypothetical protein